MVRWEFAELASADECILVAGQADFLKSSLFFPIKKLVLSVPGGLIPAGRMSVRAWHWTN